MSSPRAAAALLIALTLYTRAADWPQWRGPQRTGHAARDAKLVEIIPAEPKTIWRIKAGEGLASPVVADGRAFLFDNQDGRETLRCVDVADAKELWRTPVDEVFKDSQGPSGPRCTPVMDGDRVYVQSCRGELQCLSASDGKKIWSANFAKDFGATFIGEKGAAQGAARHGNNGSPVIDGERLYAQAGSTNGASVVCFDKNSGKVIWKSQNDVAGYGAPMIATLAGVKQLVSFTADGVIGLKPDDGAFLWRFPIKTTFSRHATTPVIYEDMILVSSHQVGLIGIKVSPAGGTLKAEQAWLNKPAAMNFASPVAVGQFLYGLGPTKNVVCLDLANGQVRWSQDGWWTTSADKAHGAFLVLGQNILTLTDSGTLVLFAAGPKECRELGRAQICGANWCNPAYVDGRAFPPRRAAPERRMDLPGAPMNPRISAGLVMYRWREGELEFFLAHPGGPFAASKDKGHWTIPKGEPASGEPLPDVAKREFEEETGIKPHGPYIELGSIRQKGGKQVFAWAFEGDSAGPVRSNTFTMEWPPHSGKAREFPEVDRAEFFTLEKARSKIKETQFPLLERLTAAVSGGQNASRIGGRGTIGL